MNSKFIDNTKEDPRYKMITQDWQLFKGSYWALIHRAYGCNGYVAGPLNQTTPKHKNCSGCGRRVDRSLLSKLPFLIKMDLVNKAWRPQDDSATASPS